MLFFPITTVGIIAVTSFIAGMSWSGNLSIHFWPSSPKIPKIKEPTYHELEYKV